MTVTPTMPIRPSSSIFGEVLAFIESPEPSLFEELALAVVRFQAKAVPGYREFLQQKEVDPQKLNSIDELPPISTAAFKFGHLECAPEYRSASARSFMTSGTTIGRGERGRHLVPRPEVYRASAIKHLRRMMFPDRARLAMLALHPTADLMPESSLSQMITWCVEEFGVRNSLCAATPERVDVPAAIHFLKTAAACDEPVCILGTTASCAALFETLGRKPVLLPRGSRLMDTGGAKGQITPLAPEEVIRSAGELLGIDPAMVVNEYGMTEMCSQMYDATPLNWRATSASGRRMKIAPPWLRPAALDPISLRRVRDGEVGMLAFFDLANVGSVSALMTEDLGMVKGGAVAILGRASAADARGCALAIEEFARAAVAAEDK